MKLLSLSVVSQVVLQPDKVVLYSLSKISIISISITVVYLIQVVLYRNVLVLICHLFCIVVPYIISATIDTVYVLRPLSVDLHNIYALSGKLPQLSAVAIAIYKIQLPVVCKAKAARNQKGMKHSNRIHHSNPVLFT